MAYLIPIAIILFLIFAIYAIVTDETKSGGGGTVTGNVLLEQFDNEDKKKAKAEIRYQVEVKNEKEDQEEGGHLPNPNHYQTPPSSRVFLFGR